MWSASIVEDGFAVPPGTTEHGVSRDGQFRLVNVVGLDRHLQYFLVRLQSNESETLDVLVVCAYHSPLSDQGARGEHERDGVGIPVARSSLDSRRPRGLGPSRVWQRRLWRAAAAAVAVVKASAGWDEASPIVIETQAERFAVTTTYVDGEWRAQVRHVPLGEQ